MKRIDSVVFDLGGVLVGLDIERCRKAFVEVGLPEVADIVNPYHPAEMIGELECGKITFPEACQKMRELCDNHTISDDRVAYAYGEFITGIPIFKMRQIDALRQKGIKTYVLSNNNPSSMQLIGEMFKADGKCINDYFDHLYLSYEMKLLKPSLEIFRAMAEHGSMIPERTLFIDDSQRNVDAARELGFQVYMPQPDEDFGHILEALTAEIDE